MADRQRSAQGRSTLDAHKYNRGTDNQSSRKRGTSMIQLEKNIEEQLPPLVRAVRAYNKEAEHDTR